MESNPWADQWDHENNSPDQTTETKKSQGGAKATNLIDSRWHEEIIN